MRKYAPLVAATGFIIALMTGCFGEAHSAEMRECVEDKPYVLEHHDPAWYSGPEKLDVEDEEAPSDVDQCYDPLGIPDAVYETGRGSIPRKGSAVSKPVAHRTNEGGVV